MKTNRLPKQYRNGLHTANEGTSDAPKVQPFQEFTKGQDELIKQAVGLIRSYPAQTLIVGFVVGAVVASLFRRRR